MISLSLYVCVCVFLYLSILAPWLLVMLGGHSLEPRVQDDI